LEGNTVSPPVDTVLAKNASKWADNINTNRRQCWYTVSQWIYFDGARNSACRPNVFTIHNVIHSLGWWAIYFITNEYLLHCSCLTTTRNLLRNVKPRCTNVANLRQTNTPLRAHPFYVCIVRWHQPP